MLLLWYISPSASFFYLVPSFPISPSVRFLTYNYSSSPTSSSVTLSAALIPSKSKIPAPTISLLPALPASTLPPDIYPIPDKSQCIRQWCSGDGSVSIHLFYSCFLYCHLQRWLMPPPFRILLQLHPNQTAGQSVV